MKYQRWMNCLIITAILLLLMPYYGIGQTDSTNYQDFSKQQLLTFELQRIARILPQAESYYHQNRDKDIVIEKKTEVINSLVDIIGKHNEIELKYQEQLRLKDQEIEAVRPKWWQNQFVIMAEVILALILGVLIAK